MKEVKKIDKIKDKTVSEVKEKENRTAQDQNGTISYSKKIWIAGAILSLMIILLVLIKFIFSILLLVLAGVLISTYFHGCANIIHKKLHLSKKWSLGISTVINILLIIAFFWYVGARLQQQAAELSDTLPKTIEHLRTQMEQQPLGNKILNFLENSGNSQMTTAFVKNFFSSGFGIVSDLYIILLLAAFFIASPSLYKNGLIKLLPPNAKDKGKEILAKLNEEFKKWLQGQIFGFFFIAVLTALGLWILGLPLILTLALIAGLSNFVPNFGPVIAAIPAILLGLTLGTSVAVFVACLYVLIQIIQSAVTQPLIQQRMLSIPPALIIFGQVVMGLMAGFWGVLLATPVIVIIMTLVNKLYIEKQASPIK